MIFSSKKKTDTPAVTPDNSSVKRPVAQVQEGQPRPTPVQPQGQRPVAQAQGVRPMAQTQGVRPVAHPQGANTAPQAQAHTQASPQTHRQPATHTQDQYARFQKPTTQAVPATESAPKHARATAVEHMEPHEEIDENGQKIFRATSVEDVNFADLWYTPEHIAYIRDKNTRFSLIPFVTDDLKEFHAVLDQGYSGNSSYAIKYRDEAYRVERIKTTTGIQFNCRKMPRNTPNIHKLGLPEFIIKHLSSLATESGLILFAGPTGMGKTTTASALMKDFLETHGGFLYTIEDPPEMPLDGIYHAKNGALGLCKQTPVENERWEDGLKSALRSKPRYVLVGEIRTPETASQTLRAATSGHLVLSTIHASSVEDALNSMLKYAASTGLDDRLVADLLARGILAVVHQQLEGTKVLKPVLHCIFANPDPLSADQLRMMIRDGKISLGTLLEAQETKLRQGLPLFRTL